MDLKDAETLAWFLLHKYGLTHKGWKFKFDRAQNRAGLCNYTTKIISLSKTITEKQTKFNIEQTIIHEIAHALTPIYSPQGKRNGHGVAWKKKAKELGYVGETTLMPTGANKNHNLGTFNINEKVQVIDGIRRYGKMVGVIIRKRRKNVEVKLSNGVIITANPALLSKV